MPETTQEFILSKCLSLWDDGFDTGITMVHDILNNYEQGIRETTPEQPGTLIVIAQLRELINHSQTTLKQSRNQGD